MCKWNYIKPLAFVLLLTVLYAFSFIIIDFIDTPVSDISDYFIIGMKWGFVVIATFILLYFISINKYIFAVFFPLLTVSCTALAYYRLTLHIQLTQMVLDLAVVNDMRTSWEAISWLLIFYLLLALIMSIAIVIYRFKYIIFKYTWIQFVVCFGVLLIMDSIWQISLPLS